MSVKLTPRLLTAVPYVRPGSVIADIGTDHAYLPIFLCESGRLTPRHAGDICAVAADINRGPVERARIHIAAAGLSERIATVETDGLCGLDRYDPADILIFGMGGELIASILSAAPWICTAERRLVLQPMTHAEKLRRYLWESGWQICGETLSREGDRIYQTICAEWSGEGTGKTVLRELTPAELMVGQVCHHATDNEQKALLAALIEKGIRTETALWEARRGARRNIAVSNALLVSLVKMRESLMK